MPAFSQFHLTPCWLKEERWNRTSDFSLRQPTTSVFSLTFIFDFVILILGEQLEDNLKIDTPTKGV